MKIMLVGGINDSKAKKLTKLIKDKCGKDIDIVNVNVFVQDPLEEESIENPDAVVMLNKQKYEFKTANVIDGLPLLYPQLGQKKVLDAIISLK